MSDLKILVCGGAGTGKSTTSVLIQQALRNAGFSNVTLIDNELTDRDRARILADEWDNNKWKESLDILIEQVQLARDNSESVCPREYRHDVYRAEGRECMYCDSLSPDEDEEL